MKNLVCLILLVYAAHAMQPEQRENEQVKIKKVFDCYVYGYAKPICKERR